MRTIARLGAALSALSFAAAAMAVDVNTAEQADLESIKGIGPTVSTQILAERSKGEFKDWSDLVRRVKGIGAGSASKFSDAGLTVAGKPYPRAADAASPVRK